MGCWTKAGAGTKAGAETKAVAGTKAGAGIKAIPIPTPAHLASRQTRDRHHQKMVPPHPYMEPIISWPEEELGKSLKLGEKGVNFKERKAV